MSKDLTASVVYLDEGTQEGGIAHPTQDLIGALEKRISVKEVKIRRGRSNNPLYWYRLGREASAGADVVHIQFEYGSFGAIAGMFLGSMFPFFARGVSVPLVATLHNFRDRRVDASLSNLSSVVEFLVENATWFVDRSLVANTDFFVPLMKSEVETLQRHGVPETRIQHIPLVPETDPEFRDSAKCKRELGLEEKSVITAFGWVRRSKGYDRVIDVIRELPEEAVFLIAGGTRTDEQEEYLQEIQKLVDDQGLEDRVQFTGYVGRDEHSTIMNATDVMVFPYRDNRASDALARALSYHIPIVTSDNEEFTAVEDQWGCVWTVSENQELSTALATLVEDSSERERLHSRAEAYAEAMNWESVAERVVNIYKSAMGRRN